MKPLYIHFAQSIAQQDVFQKTNFYGNLQKIAPDTEVTTPNYKDYFKGSQLRRLSSILKAGMSIALNCSKSCTKPFDAIILGTGLGCLTDTAKFLQNIKNKRGDLLSPTAFIQSTHNTISGQISILLNNKGYNVTHSQNSLSFEMSLIDTMTEFHEGANLVLVGGIDETHPFVKELNTKLKFHSYIDTFCASFFVVQKQITKERIAIKSVYTDFNQLSNDTFIEKVCEMESISFEEIDLILHSNSTCEIVKSHKNSVDYIDFTGFNNSASALATHFAYDFLAYNNCKSVLVVNDLFKNKGIIFLAKND